MSTQVSLKREFVPSTPEEVEARRERIKAILHRFRAHLLTETPIPRKIEVKQLEGEEVP